MQYLQYIEGVTIIAIYSLFVSWTNCDQIYIGNALLLICRMPYSMQGVLLNDSYFLG